VTPSHPWQESRIKAENELRKKYGLKNKREIWKAETALRRYRGQARTLLAKIGSDPQAKKESDQLLMHLTRMNILPPNSNLDDVLSLENESILSRRLQTITYLKGLANTPDHARQLICHGHIAIDGRRTTIPSYMVTKMEENEIGYTTDSPLKDTMHPARPRADFKSLPVKKDDKKPEPSFEKPKEEPPKKEEEKTEVKDETSKEEKPKTPVEDKKEEPTEEAKDEKPKEVVKTGDKPEPPVEDKKEEPIEEVKDETPKEEVKTGDKPEPPVEDKKEEPTEEVKDETPKEEKPEEPPKEETAEKPPKEEEKPIKETKKEEKKDEEKPKGGK